MNIIFNLQSLKYPLTGTGWYTRYLLEGLKKSKLIKQLVCIPAVNESKGYSNKSFILKYNLKKIIKLFPGTYSILNAYQNAQFIKKTRFLVHDKFIYHEPCYVLRSYSGPKICTVHDLSYIHYPEHHPKERVKFLNRNLNMNGADHIITGSNFTRNEIINVFNISPDKITSIYHGVSRVYKPRQFNEVKKILLNYHLHNKTYLLTVGTLEPRKNLERLVQAFTQLPLQQRYNYPLVLIGIKGWNTRRLEKIMQSLIKKEQLYCLGYVPESHIPYLYAGAYGFLYLSIYEGFGLPLLEAMASGVPILSSNMSAMPEVVGDATMLVNPYDIDKISIKLDQLINDFSLRDKLKKLGPSRAAQFSWESCIESTLTVYQRTLKTLGVT